jgi:hypothetical protein
MMQYVDRQPYWDFILAQKKHTYFQTSDETWHYLADLSIKPRQPVYLTDLTWTKYHHYKSVNLFAFYAPHQSSPTSPRHQVRYCVTSLPIAHTLRRLGRRRWGIECMFRDYKSSGWHIDQSGLQNPDNTDTLLVLLAINYLWATILGRWLCKSGRRSEVDAKKSVILVFFAWGLIGSFINTLFLVLSQLTLNFTINSFSRPFFRILLNGGEMVYIEMTLLSGKLKYDNSD